jgi:hypothetical protein
LLIIPHFQVVFDSSTDTVTNELIGNLIIPPVTTHNCDKEEIRAKLKDINFNFLRIKDKPIDLCVLPNGKLACTTNNSNRSILLYDENLNFIKSIEKINKPEYITCNKVNRIYLSDSKHNQIIMTDIEFKKLKIFDNKLNNPLGITYFNKHVFVCDNQNKRVLKLNDEIDFIASFSLDFQPWQIHLLQNVACIRPFDTGSIFFYNIEPFLFKTKHDYHYGTISIMNSCFYEYYCGNKKIYCYNIDGKIVEEVKTVVWTNEATHLKDGCLVDFNGKILFSCWSSGKIIVL